MYGCVYLHLTAHMQQQIYLETQRTTSSVRTNAEKLMRNRPGVPEVCGCLSGAGEVAKAAERKALLSTQKNRRSVGALEVHRGMGTPRDAHG